MAIKLTSQQIEDAQPTVEKAVGAKLKALGTRNNFKRFKDHPSASKRTTRRFYQKFLDDGGKVGDMASFFQWLMDHSDEIIAFIQKIIALFAAVIAFVACFLSTQLIC